MTKNVALGKNLVVTRASNKGGVRVRLPLNFAAIGMEGATRSQIDFICCHLASDQHGQSKLEKRNKIAVCVRGEEMTSSELVQSLVLDGDDNRGFVFAMGDMNYRIDMPPEEVVV